MRNFTDTDNIARLYTENTSNIQEAHNMDTGEGVDEAALLDEIRKYLDDKGAEINKEMEARQAAGENVFWGVPATEGIIEDLKEYGLNGIKSLEDFKASEASSEYSDAYKSVYGVRPRGHHWSDHTAEEWDDIITDLYKQGRESDPEKEEPYVHKNSDEPVNDMAKAFASVGESTKNDADLIAEAYSSIIK
jgi:hypothetical protein